jgi:hypothetical protein
LHGLCGGSGPSVSVRSLKSINRDCLVLSARGKRYPCIGSDTQWRIARPERLEAFALILLVRRAVFQTRQGLSTSPVSQPYLRASAAIVTESVTNRIFYFGRRSDSRPSRISVSVSRISPSSRSVRENIAATAAIALMMLMTSPTISTIAESGPRQTRLQRCSH